MREMSWGIATIKECFQSAGRTPGEGGVEDERKRSGYREGSVF